MGLLANIYESIIGAIFLDCGSSLDVMANVLASDFDYVTVEQAQAEIERVVNQRKEIIRRQLLIQRALKKEEQRLKREAEKKAAESKDQTTTGGAEAAKTPSGGSAAAKTTGGAEAAKTTSSGTETSREPVEEDNEILETSMVVTDQSKM